VRKNAKSDWVASLGRTKRIPDDAEGTTVYLTPDEQIALRLILARRKKRADERSSLNEIIVDGIWRILTEDERITKAQLDELLQIETRTTIANVTELRKPVK
jgi:hypothetical protein